MDQLALMLVQWPAVSAWATPPTDTLKPSEQRLPPVVMASPPAISGVNLPSARLTVSFALEPASALLTLASSAFDTVLSAVRTILPVLASVYQAVPATSAARMAELASASCE